jgi:hypothetical protein
MPVSPLIGSFFGLNSNDVPKDQFLAWSQSVENNINAIREPLTANRNYFVRTDGSDLNSGLVNSAGGAFRTIQRALNAVTTLDVRGFVVDVLVGAGTYNESLYPRPVIGTAGNFGCRIIGNASNPASVQIQALANQPAIAGINLGSGLYLFDGVHLSAASGTGIYADGAGEIRLKDSILGSCAGFHLAAYFGAVIRLAGNIFTEGDAAGHYLGSGQGIVELSGFTDTYRGARTFSNVVVTEMGGVVRQSIGGQVLDVGASVAGTRYNANTGGIINSGFRGVNHFPGSIAGGTSTGGIYA